MKKFLVVFIVILLVMSSSLYAQSTGDVNNTGSNGGAISSANDNKASIIFDDNSTKNYNSSANVPNAYPGTGSIPAGYYFKDGQWGRYYTELSNFLNMPIEQIRLASKGAKGKVNGTIYKKIDCVQKPRSIHLTNYFVLAYPQLGDEVIAAAVVKGKFGWTEEQFLVAAYAWSLDNNICSDRTSVLTMDLAKGVTRGLSIGSGVTGGTPLGMAGIGSAVGAMIGKNTTSVESEPMFTVYFLNKGPFVATKEKEGDNNNPNKDGKGSAAKMPNPPANDLLLSYKKMAEDYAEIAKNLSKPRDINVNLSNGGNSSASPSVPSPSASQSGVQADQCSGMPISRIYYKHNKSYFDLEYLKKYHPTFQSESDKLVEWAKAHQSCKIQIIGATSKIGSDGINIPLGYRRAETHRNYLVSRGLKIEQFASISDQKALRPANEYAPEDRYSEVQGLK